MTRKPRIASKSPIQAPASAPRRLPSTSRCATSMRRSKSCASAKTQFPSKAMLLCLFNRLEAKPIRSPRGLKLAESCLGSGKTAHCIRIIEERACGTPERRSTCAVSGDSSGMLEKTPATAPSLPVSDGLPWEKRRWAVAAIFTALAMASLDTAIANIALPAISAELRVSPAEVVWVVNVYQIALVATLLPLGALGEIVGHQKIYLGGLVLFTLASLGCALAWSLPSLLVARTLQGLGASGLMSVNSALVRFVYPRRMQGRGFGHNALVVATAFTLGPTIASGILALGPWPWLFAVNLPFGLAALLIGLKTLPSLPRATHAFDFPGAVLAAACLGLFSIGIDGAAHGTQPILVL